MAEFTHRQYDALEYALLHGRRVAVLRRGTELVVLPQRLATVHGKEILVALHPTTGDRIQLPLDELDGFEVLP